MNINDILSLISNLKDENYIKCKSYYQQKWKKWSHACINKRLETWDL